MTTTERFTSTNDLIEVTKLLAEVVEESCKQLELLKDERKTTTGEMKNAYTLVITNKIWCLQKLIGDYWRKTNILALDEQYNNKDDEVPKVEVLEEQTSNASNSNVMTSE